MSLRIVRTISVLLLMSLLAAQGAAAQTTVMPGSRARGGGRHLGELSVSKFIWAGVDFTGTGGEGYVLRQDTPGGPVMPGLLSSTDLADQADIARTHDSTLTNTRIVPRTTGEEDDGSVAIDTDALDGVLLVAVTQTTTFNVSGTPDDMQLLRLRLCSAASQTLNWASGAGKFDTTSPFGLALPTATTGSNKCDFFVYQFAAGSVNRWQLIANTQPSGSYGSVQLVPLSAGFTVGAGIQTAELNTETAWPRLLFDSATQECVVWTFRTPHDYGGTPVLDIAYTMDLDTNIAHQVHMTAEIMVEAAADLDVNSYVSNPCNDTAGIPGTLGVPRSYTCALTNDDGLAAGKLTKLRLCRNVATDTATDDMEVRGVLLRYTR